jgi:hypothetical protein
MEHHFAKQGCADQLTCFKVMGLKLTEAGIHVLHLQKQSIA